jgi:hypothetical protein
MGDEVLDEAEEVGADEQNGYEEAYRETRRALDEAIDLIAQFRHFTMDPDERADLGDDLLELKRQRANLVRAHLAFHQGRAVMFPPSDKLLDDILKNMEKVVDLTVERTTASAVLAIATKALNKFAEIQAL